MRVSHSELATFRECPRKHRFRYVMRREARDVSEALSIGRRIDRPEESDLLPAERAMIDGYTVMWKDHALKIERRHVKFSVKIDAIELVGEVDGIGATDGRRVVVERKTTSEDIAPGSMYWRKVVLCDAQVSTYLFAAPTLGADPTFLTYDVLRKPGLKQGKATDSEFYLRCLEDISERPEHYYQRQVVVRSKTDHESFVRDLRGIVHLMQAVNEMVEAPRNTDSCYPKFKKACDYASVCAGEASIEDFPKRVRF